MTTDLNFVLDESLQQSLIDYMASTAQVQETLPSRHSPLPKENLRKIDIDKVSMGCYPTKTATWNQIIEPRNISRMEKN